MPKPRPRRRHGRDARRFMAEAGEQRRQIRVIHHLLPIRHFLEASEDEVERGIVALMAKRFETTPHRVSPGVLPKDERAPVPADSFATHDLVRERILEYTVLMDPGLVREGVATDDGLVRGDSNPRAGGHET